MNNNSNYYNNILIYPKQEFSEKINIRVHNEESGGYHPYFIQILSNDLISVIIEKYRNESNDNRKNIKFIFNGKELNINTTASEAGLSNNSNIFVVKCKY